MDSERFRSLVKSSPVNCLSVVCYLCSNLRNTTQGPGVSYHDITWKPPELVWWWQEARLETGMSQEMWQEPRLPPVTWGMRRSIEPGRCKLSPMESASPSSVLSGDTLMTPSDATAATCVHMPYLTIRYLNNQLNIMLKDFMAYGAR